MSFLKSDEAPVAPPPDARSPLERLDPRLVLYAAVMLFAVGLFLQTRTATVLIACQRQGDRTMACDLDHRVLFGTLSISRERVTGVARARSVAFSARRHQSYTVVLDTADGEREAGWSTDVYPSITLAHEINQRISAGTAGFDGAMQLSFSDRLLRLGPVLMSVVGVALVPVSVLCWRRQRSGGLIS